MATTAVTPETVLPAPAPAKVGLLPILIAVLLAVVVALGAVVGVGFWFVHSGRLAKLMPAAPGGAAVAEKAHPAETAPDDLPPTHVLALEPLVVNLSDPGGRAYLRATISLRLQDEPKSEGKKAEKPEGGAKGEKVETPANLSLRDTTLAVLSSQTSEQLLAAGGIDALKKHLRQVYALQNVDQHVIDVYVTDFLVQRG